jgi:hypothetical protein
MPRKKINPKQPKEVARYTDDEVEVIIVEIDEETENFGKGASAKVRRLKNFNKALDAFANEYFWGQRRIRLKSLIHNPRKITALANELILLGIDLEDRALRNLAVDIKKNIIAFENALKNK